MRDPQRLEALAAVLARFRPTALRRAWPLALAIIVILVVGSGLVFSRHGRPAVSSALLLPDMLLELPVRPVTWLTPEPTVERGFIDYGSGRILVDIYRPAGDEPRAAVIFSMGAPPLDLDDSRLVKLAEDAARAGLLMVVPFSRRLDAERIEPAEIDALVGIYQHLERQPYVDPDRIGYIGVSVGGSLALVAAADPRIADRVDYVVSFGGYSNGLDALVAIGSHHIHYDGLEETWEPDSHSVEVMALLLIAELSDGGDRETICKAFVDPGDRRTLCGLASVDREPVSDVEVARLTPEGRAAYDIMTGRDPARAEELLSRLPPSALAKLEELSPDRVIAELGGEIYIIHDKGDEFIPYVESRRMRDALAGRDDVHFTEVSLFEHVEPRLSRGGDVIVLDGTRLYYRLYQLLLKLS